MITYTAYEAYFLSLATRYNKIRHSEANRRFAIMDIDDILAGTRTGMDFSGPTMILENPEGKLAYKHNGLRDENFGAFMILKQAITRGDAEEKRGVMDLTKQVGIAVLTKIQKEKEGRFSGSSTAPPRFIEFFDLAQVQYNKVGPIFANTYGWRFEFNIGLDTPLIYNPDDWAES